nr:DUF4876 domain-containing protein [uncultured Draconibacterium sp.]
MKKLIYLISIFSIILTYSCKDDDEINFTTVNVQLSYPDNIDPAEGITVTLSNSSGSSFTALTNAAGLATFQLTYDVYDASVTEKRSEDGSYFVYNGTVSGINVSSVWDTETSVEIELTASESSQIIIKELYISGCPKDDGSGSYGYDQYVILYNNSDQTASLDNICLGTLIPWSSYSTSSYLVDGTLSYLSQDWVPASHGIPYTQSGVSLEPGEEMVIALCGAIDHTTTYSNSVNLADSKNWVLYDNGVLLTHSKYVAPDASIPTSQYLGFRMWGKGNGWAFSNNSPAFFIYTTKGSTPEAFASSTDNYTEEEPADSPHASKMCPNEWILDGVEVFRHGRENYKRFPDGVDAGSIELTRKLGYTVYRNVDKAATEAITENAGKLVYNYAYGTEVDGVSSTDPSGIDAEASIANGARIIYMDTNNSSNDFHQRSQASLRD